jgi:hypothetical protein
MTVEEQIDSILSKQTPYKGHPIFIAQHATATCCRECLEKWHSIERGKELGESEKQYIIAVWKRWLLSQVGDGKVMPLTSAPLYRVKKSCY